jgi:hypothetical protein
MHATYLSSMIMWLFAWCMLIDCIYCIVACLAMFHVCYGIYDFFLIFFVCALRYFLTSWSWGLLTDDWMKCSWLVVLSPLYKQELCIGSAFVVICRKMTCLSSLEDCIVVPPIRAILGSDLLTFSPPTYIHNPSL